MIKKTFYNLPKAKQDRIINAIKNEFNRASIDKLSINNIIKDANISRGSFYQYFDDKSDLYDIIADQMMDSVRAVFSKFLTENKGDLFQTFDAVVNLFLYGNYPDFLYDHRDNLPLNSHNAKTIVDKINTRMLKFADTLVSNIDPSNLKVKDLDDLQSLLILISSAAKEVTFDHRVRKLSKEQCLENYRRKIDIIKNGAVI